MKAELKREAVQKREKGLQATPEDVESFREELDSYKKDKLIYDKEMEEYTEKMKEWEKDKTGYKPLKPFPAFPPIMPPLRFPPELVEEYKDVMKERKNSATGTIRNESGK